MLPTIIVNTNIKIHINQVLGTLGNNEVCTN